MKISISGLGIIPDSQICLRPLTIFVGENGTGKTWTAYTIAGIFGRHGYNKYMEAYKLGEADVRYAPIDKAINDLIKKGSATLNLVDFANKYAEIYINEIAKMAPNWLNDFLGTTRAIFGKMKISVEMTEASKQVLSNSLMAAKFKSETSVGIKKSDRGMSSSGLTVNCLKEKDSDELYFYTTHYNNDVRQVPLRVAKEEIRNFVITRIFGAIAPRLYSDVAIFPTERTTFITFPFPYDKGKHIKSAKLEQAQESESPSVSWRLSHPVSNLLTIIDSCTRRYSMGQEKKAQRSKFIRLAKFLEDKILSGKISTEKRGNQVQILHTPSEEVDLELNVSSSMVKELTPLALYLRCLAKPGDLVVIDEPEMNLHPAAQVQLAEFLGMLVNAGLHLLITTHSPYIVDHIPNLIRANDLDKQKVKKHFYLRQVTSFLPKEKVSVYLFDYNAVTDILQENGDINWETFSNVSRDLSRIYSNLIQ